jgi:hypothetical protein
MIFLLFLEPKPPTPPEVKIIYKYVEVPMKKPKMPPPKPKYPKDQKYPKNPKMPMPMPMPKYPKQPKIPLIDWGKQIPMQPKDIPQFMDKLKPQSPFYGKMKPMDPLAGINTGNPMFNGNPPNYGGPNGNGFGLPDNKLKGYPGVGMDNSNTFANFFNSFGNDEHHLNSYSSRGNDEPQSVSLTRNRLLPRNCLPYLLNPARMSRLNKHLSKVGLDNFLNEAVIRGTC